MNLTGQCKEDFEKWLCNNHTPIWREYLQHKVDRSNWIPFSAWYGIFVDFFDSCGIFIEIPYFKGQESVFWYHITHKLKSYGGSKNKVKTRHQAREEAIKAANNIYNE